MSKAKLATLVVGFLLLLGVMWGAILAMGLGPQLGLDLRGGVSITLEPDPGQEVNDDVLDQTVTVIRERIDALGVAEPDIARQGERIVVQLPGVADLDEAREIVGRTAQLQMRAVQEVIEPSDEGYEDRGQPCDEQRTEMTGPADPGSEVVLCETASGAGEDTPEGAELAPGERTKYLLAPVAVSGEHIADARAETSQTGAWRVSLSFDQQGAQQFAELTGELACQPQGSPQRRLAIVLDNVVESALPPATQVVCGTGITGGESVINISGGEEEARELALVLKAGALPLQLSDTQAESVSPRLGEASLRAGLVAGFLGLALVAGYLVLLYRGMGVAAVTELAVFGLVIYAAIILLGEAMGFTLTLAGIAGIIAAVGIAADSSIIYRERYRDEIRLGRTVRSAADHAFSKAFRTNLTGNAVTFLAAVVLWALAMGPVRGFAFTLGLATIVDTVLFGTFTRGLFGLIARNPKLARSRLVGLGAETVAPETVVASGPPAAERGAGKTGAGKSGG